jgi:hypothetical protein
MVIPPIWELRTNPPWRSACESAWGLDTDRHDKHLKFLDTKVAYFVAETQALWISFGIVIFVRNCILDKRRFGWI